MAPGVRFAGTLNAFVAHSSDQAPWKLLIGDLQGTHKAVSMALGGERFQGLGPPSDNPRRSAAARHWQPQDSISIPTCRLVGLSNCLEFGSL